MLQCKECEYFHRDENSGQIMLKCSPFDTVKEPACLQKLQLLRMDTLCRMYGTMMQFYQKLSPMQEKMMKYMEKEIDDIDESESWKQSYDDDDNDEPSL